MTHPTDTSIPDDVLLPRDRGLLVDAIRHDAVARPRRRRPSRRVVVLATAGVLATGTAVAATTPWEPELGRPGDRPSRSATPVPADQIAVLGVLRRKQTDDDRSPATRQVLRKMFGSISVGVRTDSVRRLARGRGGAAVLVSVEQDGVRDADPGHPMPVTSDALCLERTIPTRRGTTVGEKCGSLDDLRSGHLRFPTAGLVPDGVASVRVRLRTGTVLTARVTNNYFALPIDIDADGRDDPRQAAAMRRFHALAGRPIRWLDRDGRIVHKAPR
jgi:hypothetical protein